MHLDHGGNVGKFPKSTIVVQKDEVRNAFGPSRHRRSLRLGDILPLRKPYNNLHERGRHDPLNGDQDVFGDGTSW